jgi:hypothetical protein
MSHSKVFGAVPRWGVVLSSLLVAMLISSVGVPYSSAATLTPEQVFSFAMSNAAHKKFVVITMTGTNAAGTYRDVWRSNPHSGTLVESEQHPGATGHVYVTVLNRVVYEKIDAAQWAFSGLGAKYKSLENRWFVIRKSSSSYKAYLEQEVISGSLLIPVNGTQFTIEDNTVLHGVKVVGLEGALTGSNPVVPVTLVVTKSKNPIPLEVSVPKTSKNKDVWTATYAFRKTASVITAPTTSLAYP